MAGRRPNSKKTHAARGNAGKRPAPATPEAPGGLIVPLPEVELDEFAKDEWERVVRDLQLMGIARPIYATILSLYCMTVGKIRHAFVALGKENIVVPGKQGPKLNANFELAYKLMTRLMPLATECGITPASTRRLHAPELAPAGELEQEQEFFAPV